MPANIAESKGDGDASQANFTQST